uniref:F-box/LRR-repeat protein 14 isoform X2 n=1 Tax=Rhizophora mucronata TaxID=61149 RepID=A0A2P2MLF0_RHIMU
MMVGWVLSLHREYLYFLWIYPALMLLILDLFILRTA